MVVALLCGKYEEPVVLDDDDFIDGVDEFYQTWDPDLGSDYDDYNDED